MTAIERPDMGSAGNFALRLLKDFAPIIAALWVAYVYINDHAGTAATQRQQIEDHVAQIQQDVVRIGASENLHEARDATFDTEFNKAVGALAVVTERLSSLDGRLGDLKSSLARVEDKVDKVQQSNPGNGR